MPCRLRIGLTGGMGSGKSTVSRMFEDLGVPVIDADRLAREVVEPGEPALAEVIAAFGPGVAAADGRLDRAALRAIVFSDDGARARLESLLHPRIRERMESAARAVTAPYCILAIPLLVETRQRDLVDRVLVVDCPERLQVARVCAREQVDPATARAFLRAQATREARLAAADDVVPNDSTLETLRRRVDELHARYLDLARRP
jgi:dephospho-CoA kinase